MSTITKPCLAPYHPFKGKTYKYTEGEGSANYCSSCKHFSDTMLTIMAAIILRPFDTLYGNQTIKLSREDAHAFLDAAYDLEASNDNRS